MADVEAVVDPFAGRAEISLAEYEESRKPAEEVPAAETPAAPAETVEGQEPPKEAEQEKREENRDEKGRYKKVEFSAEQQEVFNRELARAKRRERETVQRELAGNTARQTSETQVTATDSKPKFTAQSFLSNTPPPEPDLPVLETFAGTLAEFDAAQKQAKEDIKRWHEARFESQTLKRDMEQRLADAHKRLKSGHSKFVKTHADYDEELAALDREVEELKTDYPEEAKKTSDLMNYITYETEIPHEIAYHFFKNRDELRELSELPPNQAVRAIHRLEGKLMNSAPAPEKKPAAPKPAPPAPVGARAATSAFDVNDEKLSPDEWAKQRNKQLYGSRR